MKILICDDEAVYLRILCAHVREYMKNRYICCEITATTNPTEIMKNTQAFDLAFLDIQMEGIDGITLAKELRERNRKLVLFFVTNFDEYQDDANVSPGALSDKSSAPETWIYFAGVFPLKGTYRDPSDEKYVFSR